MERKAVSQDGSIVSIALDTISFDPRTQMRVDLNADALARYTEQYREEPGKMPPIDVFVLADPWPRRVLGDGHTRKAAAERAGLRELPAHLHLGTLADAVHFAARANATHGMPLTKGDLPTAVHNMRTVAPDLSVDALAQALSCSVRTVVDIVRADEVRAMAATMGIHLMDPNKPHQERPYTHFEAIGRAPRDHWSAVIRAADSRCWTREEIRLAGNNLQNRNTTEKHRTALLAGEDDPRIVLPDGQFEYHSDTLRRGLVERQHQEDERRKGDRLRGSLAVQHALDQMHAQGRHAVHCAEEVPFTEDDRQYLGMRLTQVRRVVDQLDDMIMGQRRADWQEQLRVIEGQGEA